MKFIPNNIDTIIFDLGGVVLDIDSQKTIDQFAAITGLGQQKLVEYGTHKVFKQFEKGEIPSDQFRVELATFFNIEVDNKTLDTAWNAMLLDLPLNRLEMIGKLRPNYKTFVLSNTNEIHVVAFDKMVSRATQGKKITDFFDKVYYSFQVGLRKPDIKIFKMVIERNILDTSKTLFIDDTLEHIESAKKVGLQTWHLTNQKDLITVFGHG